MVGKMIRCIIKNTTNRRISMSHHSFHAISSTHKVTFIDAFYPTGANKNVFVIIGHSHHFVWYNLPNG